MSNIQKLERSSLSKCLMARLLTRSFMVLLLVLPMGLPAHWAGVEIYTAGKEAPTA